MTGLLSGEHAMIPYTTNGVLLHIDHVSLALGGRPILRDVSATVHDLVRDGCTQGQVICFLGPSGIGKTRLARLMAGLDAPTSGEITLGHDRPVHKGLVGMVAQQYTLFDYMTVWENLAVAAKQGAHGTGWPLRAMELMDALGLRQYKDYYPNAISGGTRQRVAIVRQLLCSEHYLILDEPFSGLDVIMKRRACDLITKVANLHELNTIIVVTHDVTEGMSVADTVWLMGLERDAAGAFIHGARLVENYDLAAEGLCWRPDIATDPVFLSRVADVKARFLTLVP